MKYILFSIIIILSYPGRELLRNIDDKSSTKINKSEQISHDT